MLIGNSDVPTVFCR